MRAELLEELATIDEDNEGFMTKVLENPDSFTEDEINAAIRKGVCQQTSSILSFADPPSKTKAYSSFSMRLSTGCLLLSIAA